MTDHNHDESILRHHGLRPTANRLLVLRALRGAAHPMSIGDLESALDTIDVSSVFRVMTAFVSANLVHSLEDGSGSIKYELCHGRHSHDGNAGDDDSHVHFYCEKCLRTFCFADMPVPTVALPEGFAPRFTNYMVKGLCPDCATPSPQP